MNLKDYKVIECRYYKHFNYNQFMVLVDSVNLELCKTITDEKIIIHIDEYFHLIDSSSFMDYELFATSNGIQFTYKCLFFYTVEKSTTIYDNDAEDVTKPMKRIMKIKKIMNS